MTLIIPGTCALGHFAVDSKGSMLKDAVRMRKAVENAPQTTVVGGKGEDGEVACDAIDETGIPFRTPSTGG